MKLSVLGLNDPFHGTFVKVQLLLKEVVTLPPNQLVLFIDAYDTLIFPSIKDLPMMYRNGDMTNQVFKEIVFGAERSITPYPDPGIGGLYEPKSKDDTPFYFLNSGIILGTAGAFVDMAMSVVSYPSVLGSDQRGYTRYYLTHRDKVGLDVEGVAFLNLHAVSETSYIDINSAALKNDVHRNMELRTGKLVRPSVIHGNGGERGGKEYYRNINSVAILGMKDAGNSTSILGENRWISVTAPPFTYAALVQEGRMGLNETLEIFYNHIKRNPSDVQSLLYLSVELSKLGKEKEAQFFWSQAQEQLHSS
uniref:PLOD1-3-like GT domain-containing protein n=1 Tax=Eucampia antarctica TaxID=49252 RepID=A0A7S2WIQ4_9STRA